MSDEQKLYGVQLSAYTRVQCYATALAGPGITDAEVADAVEDHVDGGDYEDDDDTWDQNPTTVEMIDKVEPSPNLIVYRVANGDVVVQDVKDGAGAELLAARLAEVKAEKEAGDGDEQ